MGILSRLASLRLFFICLFLLLAACILGGVIPQRESFEKYQELFGTRAAVWIMDLRLQDVFGSFWFIGLLGLTGINLLACSFQRWKALSKRTGVLIAHTAVLFIFAGGIVRALFSERGFLPLAVGTETQSMILEDGRPGPLPFSVGLKDFRIHYWEQEKHRIHAFRVADGLHEWVEASVGQKKLFNPIGIWVQSVRFYPNFAMGKEGPFSRDEARENPAILVQVESGGKSWREFLFAHFPDFHHNEKETPVRLIYEYLPGRIKQFESRLAITQAGREVLAGTIKVNSPLQFGGYRFYQSGYDPKNPAFSTIQVSKDPGVPLIYLGFGLLLFGLGWAFLSHPGRV